MDVQVPVYLYDVVTVAVPFRLVVTCTEASEAQALAGRLNELRGKGVIVDQDAFTVGRARAASVTVTVDAGTSVRIGNYAVDVGRLAIAPPPP